MESYCEGCNHNSIRELYISFHPFGSRYSSLYLFTISLRLSEHVESNDQQVFNG